MPTSIEPVRIGKHLVGPGQRTLIVAEIGINHNAEPELAMRLASESQWAGADLVKLQTRTVPVVYTEAELSKPREVPAKIIQKAIKRGVLSEAAIARLQASSLESTTNGDLKHALEFTDDELRAFDAHCRKLGVGWFTSCWDVQSLERIVRLFPDMPCHKVASACNEDDELMRAIRKTGKPIILSTGMSNLDGVRAAVEVLGTKDLVMLHCTSVYPKASEFESGDKTFELINLRGMETLERTFGVPIGFSSHDTGIQPTYASVALGAVMIEKHVTLERGMWGSDHGASVEFKDFAALCKMIRELRIALGDGRIVIYPEEEEMAKKLRRVRRVKT